MEKSEWEETEDDLEDPKSLRKPELFRGIYRVKKGLLEAIPISLLWMCRQRKDESEIVDIGS